MRLERRANALYTKLNPAARQEAVERVSSILTVAGEHDIALKPRHAPYIFLGRENIPWWHKLVKRKLKKVEKKIQQKEGYERVEQAERENLQQWLARDVSASITLAWDAIGDELLQTPTLIRGAGGQDDAFHLRSLLSVASEVEGRLDEAAIARLRQREEFWSRLGITSGPELQVFMAENLKRKRVNLNGKRKPPVEMRWLKAAHPDDFQFLQDLQTNHGYVIELIKSIQSPGIVSDSIRSVASGSQHGFISTWFNDFVLNGVEPMMLPSDEALLKGVRILQGTRAEETRQGKGKWRRRLKLKPKPKQLLGDVQEVLAEDSYQQKLKQRTALDLIRDFIPLTMSIDVANEHDDPATRNSIRERIKSINDTLDQELGKDYAAKRLRFEDSVKVSKKSLEILEWTLGVAVVSSGLEAIHAGFLAKGLAASADDILNEWAALNVQSTVEGKTIKDLVKKRAKVLGPVFGVAMGLAFGVETIRKFGGDRLGGLAFMVAATILSGATVGVSSFSLGKNYQTLAREGKLHDYYSVVPQQQAESIKDNVKGLEAEQDPKQAIWQGIKTYLEHSGETDEAVIEKQRQLFYRFAEGKDTEQILDRLKDPSVRSRLGHGFKEAAAVNPSGGFILAATITAPAVGWLLGPLFLPIPLLYSAAGSYEGQVGVVGGLLYKASSSLLWRRHVNKKIDAIEEAK